MIYRQLSRYLLLSPVLVMIAVSTWYSFYPTSISSQSRQSRNSDRPGAVLTVTNTNDSGAGSLRQAVIDAAPDDTIVFDSGVTGSIILTTGQISLNKNLTIIGPGANVLAISGNDASRVFSITAGVTINISGLTIRNGSVANEGGGIRNLGTLILTNSAVANNHANGGGGIWNMGTAMVSGTTISGNSANFDGGGFYNLGNATSELVNTTISNNSGTSAGLANAGSSGQTATLSLTNCTVTANTATQAAILSFNFGGAVVTTQLRNTIIAGNSGANFSTGGGATVNSQGFTLDSDGTSGLTNGVNGNIVGTMGSPVDALLGPLSNNGGPTLTHALLAGSPAIDQGHSSGSTTDQRGFSRPIDLPAPNASGGDGADIGAFEAQTIPGAIFTVTNTNDSGAGSLRQAMLDANSSPGLDTINFNIPGSGVRTVSPTTELPFIQDPVVLDATSQPGYAGQPLIELNGGGINGVSGFQIITSGCTIKGFAINRFNNDGIFIQGNDNQITGNYIGTDSSGTAGLPRRFSGVYVVGDNNVIGGASALERNLISGSTDSDEEIALLGSGNIVAGNYIGTDVSGSIALGGGGVGIQLGSGNRIGGTQGGERNIIAFNIADGVRLSGNAGSNNAIMGNSIHSNGNTPEHLGVELLPQNGVTPNDPGDVDTGPNNLQNFPILTSAATSGANTTIQGALNSTPNALFRIEFFNNYDCDPSGHGEGRIFLGSTNVTTDGSGNAPISVSLSAIFGGFVTSTATKSPIPGDTSEFSPCVGVTAPLSNGKIAYERSGQLFTINPDGSGNQLLYAGEAHDPEWSPDGSRLAFITTGPMIAVINSEGTGFSTVPNTMDAQTPSWSPDGTQLVFAKFRNCVNPPSNTCNEIFKIGVDGSALVQLTSDVNDFAPNFSPDGTKIAFTRSATDRDNIFTMNADGTGQTALTTGLNSFFHPDWSPDGQQLAFSGDAPGLTQSVIWKININGTGLTQLTFNPDPDDQDPVWSPDGTRIAFSAEHGPLDEEDIFIVNADGTGEIEITNSPATVDLGPTWQNSSCALLPIEYGQTAAGSISLSTCVTASGRTNLYTFAGTAGQQIAITMEANQFVSRIELLNPAGQVIATAGGMVGVFNSRVPSNGYLPLTATGTYTIRASGVFAALGDYTLSLFEASGSGGCTYSISPTSVDVPAGGGSFSFDVMTQPGCPPASTPPVSGTIYSGLTYTGGRVRFNVSANTGSFRSETIPITGISPVLSFTINQCGTGPPGNDHFANAAVINGPNGMHNEIISNSVATAEAGEPSHAGNTAVKSVWYSWTAPANGLYSFSTSGSDFNTVMAVYACPASGNCTFASMTQVVSNDDTTFYDVTSKVNFRADLGRTYKIAVDGKNGASGNVELSWRQYQRLFRLYLQTYNGTQSPIVPDSITASNGMNTVTPLLVSLGVYEFNLPADNTVYTVTITGPTGIVWDPNGFPLDTSFTSLDELMQGLTGQQNTVSNAQFQLPQSIFGFIKNITPQEVPALSVILASSRGPNPRPPVDCTEIVAVPDPPGQFVRYRCTSYPNTLHDIIPRMTGKAFALPVRSFEAPISGTVLATTSTAMIASSATTYTLAGNVTSGGSGVQVDLRYTPVAGAPDVTLRTSTNSAGAYSFGNLPAGTFQLTARRMGLVFGPAQQVTLPGGGGPVNITPQTVCTYAPAGLSTTAFAGGPAQFSVAVNDPACEWLATTTAPWIVINSGATVGNGPVHYTLQNNAGIARAGIIMVGDQPVQIQQEGEIPPSGIEGDLSPRGGPDGAVLSNDVIQLRRFVTGLDTLNGAVNEGQRADIAPRSSLGDGALASSDVVQARRYVTGLDPQTNAGGPAIALSSAPNPLREMPSDDRPSTRQVRFGRIEEVSFGSITVPVEIVGFGNETALSFTVEYDPSVLASPKIELADAAYGAELTVNAKEKGRIGILIDSAVPIAPAAAARIINLTFDVAAPNTDDVQFFFTDSIIRREVSDEAASSVKARFQDTAVVFGRIR